MAVSQALSVTEVSGSVSTANNSSDVKIVWTSTQSGDSYNGYTRTAYYWVSINGGAETKYSVSYTLPKGTTQTILEKTITVAHKSDGSGSVKVRTWMDTGISAGEIELSKTATLTTIARASTITDAPGVTIGNNCSIKWTPASASFRYKIKFSMGSWSYITGAIHPNRTSAYTYSGYTIPLSCADQYASGWASGTMTATLYTYSDSACTKNVGFSSEKTFTATLPGASSITSASDTTLGNKLSVKFTPNNANYRYKVKLTIPGTNYIYPSDDTDDEIVPGTTSAYTYQVTLGIADIAKYIKSKTGTMTATITTYRDSECELQVGSAYTKTFTVTVPDTTATRPTTAMTLSAVNSGLNSTFDGLYIQGKSRVKATFSNTFKYGAALKSNAMSVDGKNYTSSPWQSSLLSTAGTKTITGTVTDSRDHKGTDTETITIIPYSVPMLQPVSGKKEIVCARCDSNGKLSESGTSIWVELRRVYSPVTAGGVQKNYCAIQYRWKLGDDGEDGFYNWQTLLSNTNTSTDTFQSKLPNLSPNTKKSYDVEFRAVDTIGGVSPTVAFSIPTDEVTFHLGKGGKRVSVGKWSEPKYDASGKEIPHFEVPDGWSTYLRGSVYGNVYGLAEAETEIQSGQDFNSILDFGVYSIPSNAVAKTLLNCPVQKAGKLIVSSANGSGKKSGTYTYILQEFISFDGYYHCYREVYTGETDVWIYNEWEYRSSINWQSLGLHADVKAPSSNIGRSSYQCAYRVENNNHVYISFQCGADYSGTALQVNANAIPEELRPKRYIYGFCANSSKYISRISVSPGGYVTINWVQSLASGSETTAVSMSWIDGYIDYWI